MKINSFKYACILFLFAFTTASAQTVGMTFNVDMNPTGLLTNDQPLNVRMKGDLPPLDWALGIEMTDADQDGIYSATINFETEEKNELTFKYVVNNVEWEGGENLKTQIKPHAKPYNSAFRYVQRPENPFKKFIGEWTLKDDNWVVTYGNERFIQKIPNHFTTCKEINTDNSLLWVIEAPNSRGHIFWTYDHAKKEVFWSSNFYSYRTGTGKGTQTENGDLYFKLTFEGDADGAYGIYTYRWISDNEYELKSVQYNSKDEVTGGYGGTFIRNNKL